MYVGILIGWKWNEENEMKITCMRKKISGEEGGKMNEGASEEISINAIVG